MKPLLKGSGRRRSGGGDEPAISQEIFRRCGRHPRIQDDPGARPRLGGWARRCVVRAEHGAGGDAAQARISVLHACRPGIRGGLQSVPYGQIEAARACGMWSWLVYRRIILPIALRHALPAYGNEIILTMPSGRRRRGARNSQDLRGTRYSRTCPSDRAGLPKGAQGIGRAKAGRRGPRQGPGRRLGAGRGQGGAKEFRSRARRRRVCGRARAGARRDHPLPRPQPESIARRSSSPKRRSQT